MEKVRQVVDKALVLKPYLQLLSQGNIFKSVSSWFIRIVTGAVTLWFFIEWISMWKTIFEMSGSMVLILSLLMILSLGFMFIIINIMLVKADLIAALPENKDYIVIPIAVLFVKLAGELLFFTLIFLGFAGFFVSLTDGGKMLLRMIPFFDGVGFADGVKGLVISLGVAYFLFLLHYFIAEQIGVFADIAKNTKK